MTLTTNAAVIMQVCDQSKVLSDVFILTMGVKIKILTN